MRNRLLFFIAKQLCNYPKGQEYGLKIFRYFMPYGEDSGYEIRYTRHRGNTHDIS